MVVGNRCERPAMAGAAAAALSLLLAAVAGQAKAQDFEAVLAAPDDIPLNLAFARAQVLEGNLSVAASTLERVLITDPNLHSARLFYAVVLFRLGDLQGAQEELRRLEGVDLSPLQRAEAQGYTRRIEQGLSPRSLSGRLSAGLVYEDDAAGAYFTAFEFLGAPTPESGLASEVSLRLDGRMGLGSGRVYELYGSGLLFDRRRLSGAGIDFQRADVAAGVSRTTRLTEARIGLTARLVRLDDEPQLAETGLTGDFSWRVENALTLTARAEIVQQDYDEPGIDLLVPLLGGDRDGERYLAGAGLSYRLTSRSTAGLGLDYEVKTAGYEPFGYAGPRLYASFDQRFDKGVYVLASASVRQLDYDADDVVFLGGARREDTRVAARVAVGAPLSAFTRTGATGDAREAVTLEGALFYSRRDSTAPLADFEGWGAEARLVWRFGSH